jgi:hypothetical protein
VSRREFITLLGGAAVWPLAARAQQGEAMRRVGVLLPAASDNPRFKAWFAGFLRALQELEVCPIGSPIPNKKRPARHRGEPRLSGVRRAQSRGDCLAALTRS